MKKFFVSLSFLFLFLCQVTFAATAALTIDSTVPKSIVDLYNSKKASYKYVCLTQAYGRYHVVWSNTEFKRRNTIVDDNRFNTVWFSQFCESDGVIKDSWLSNNVFLDTGNCVYASTFDIMDSAGGVFFSPPKVPVALPVPVVLKQGMENLLQVVLQVILIVIGTIILVIGLPNLVKKLLMVFRRLLVRF